MYILLVHFVSLSTEYNHEHGDGSMGVDWVSRALPTRYFHCIGVLVAHYHTAGGCCDLWAEYRSTRPHFLNHCWLCSHCQSAIGGTNYL